MDDKLTATTAQAGERPVVLLDVLDTVVVDPMLELLPDFFEARAGELFPKLRFDLWRKFERNEIDEATMLNGLFKDGRSYDHSRFLSALAATYRFMPGMERLLQRLSERCEVHLISNYPTWYRSIEERLGLTRFAPWTFVSCETGLRKPDPRAFRQACEKLGRRPDELLFIDDSGRNCNAARALGMSTWRFHDAKTLEAELVRRGVFESIDPSATEEPRDYHKDIEKMMERFLRALASSDAEEIASLYSDDACVLPQGQPPIRGRENIHAHWQRFIDSGAQAHDMVMESVEGSGDLAYEVGSWIGIAPIPPTFQLQDVVAKYTSVWRWEAGIPKLVVDMFSANS